MKTYIYTKIIKAIPVHEVNVENQVEKGLPAPVILTGKGSESRKFGFDVTTREESGGYFYTNLGDDQRTWHMSADDFEQNCRPVDAMTFGDALEALKDGYRVARKGWNGKGQYVFLAYEPDFVTDADISAIDPEAPVSDMLVLKTAQDIFQPGWLATQSDMLAEDWYVVE